MCRRDPAGEHPLEVLYQARDAAWHAASRIRDADIPAAEWASYEPAAEWASYEHVLSGLLQAVGVLNSLSQPLRPEDAATVTAPSDHMPSDSTPPG